MNEECSFKSQLLTPGITLYNDQQSEIFFKEENDTKLTMEYFKKETIIAIMS